MFYHGGRWYDSFLDYFHEEYPGLEMFLECLFGGAMFALLICAGLFM